MILRRTILTMLPWLLKKEAMIVIFHLKKEHARYHAATSQLADPGREIHQAFPNRNEMIKLGYRPTVGDLVPKHNECIHIHNQYGSNPCEFITFLLKHMTNPNIQISISYFQKHFWQLFELTTNQPIKYNFTKGKQKRDRKLSLCIALHFSL